MDDQVVLHRWGKFTFVQMMTALRPHLCGSIGQYISPTVGNFTHLLRRIYLDQSWTSIYCSEFELNVKGEEYDAMAFIIHM